MLVLGRKFDQKIVIGEPGNRIIITVADLRGEVVRLGIEADTNTPINREEVYRKIHGLGPEEPL